MLTTQIERTVSMAQMATDTLAGLNKIDRAVELFRGGLISESECLSMLRGW